MSMFATFQVIPCMFRARFLFLTLSMLRLCSANHRPGYWSNLPCHWRSTAWAYSEQETRNGPCKRDNLKHHELVHDALNHHAFKGMTWNIIIWFMTLQSCSSCWTHEGRLELSETIPQTLRAATRLEDDTMICNDQDLHTILIGLP